ncbi:MAG: 2-amino-4-hydroxy-6-hydroxymethyldihydropteridine diphosphokinase [Bacteroidales bacterium]|jgi:2-amino-4-hydroxy-6-hydroxymethyldihydropteridine diphosphokinase|nr:2-amino-4-hydroxy-6-hydroxymethyldihydropteridine diphosphokinase [Bacteroidales bacterium]NCU35511.1 2-amino-4-hydroxy-6-hydroxymethyldihydropteridine diphosphokinase [Candidatus Falkowbacteria bacterium]MDD2632893.1 2-amino-4-hydroxy-6-hydroxymethyldihydropteridine diphosphokinase [Bacteroidales bacterium]MDD3131441.1 2-amino-4-hydroxy-6-hydroxymethyldihydropteridine diphosphokinase [Bacteroidales bacterium]MDD3527399.1 2-amino-4-hydroxy-6-hydroxymethyldihydropteridine diphosphokinase [Bac
MMHQSYLLLGSNKGNRERNIVKAVKAIAQQAGIVSKMSSLYRSQPWGFQAEKDFYNLALLLQTPHEPHTLLHILLEIEKSLGRVRDSKPGYTSRTIDIDILFYDKLILESPKLILPHPRIQERRFVLRPMMELDQDYKHPVSGFSIAHMLAACNDTSEAEEIKKMENIFIKNK